MQFIGRFEMHPDAELEMVCKTMDISAVSIERIEDEFEKLLLKSKRPSLGIALACNRSVDFMKFFQSLRIPELP